MTRMLWTIFCIAGLLAGCPAPPDTTLGSGGDGGGGDGGGGDGGGGVAAEDGRLPPGAGHDLPSEFDQPPGKSVKISGTVSYDGTHTGQIYVDFVKHEEGATPPSRVVHSQKLDALGPWEVLAPKNIGKIDIMAFIDLDSNGPNPGEPIGAVHDLEVGEEPLVGVEIVLSEKDDGEAPGATTAGEPIPGAPGAGELMPPADEPTPGSVPPPGTEPAPGDAPPADEAAPADAGDPAEPAPEPAPPAG